ncbi:ROK family protein [Flavobacterium sp. CFBP9031]|uniref:ROK family protein n=1 Tax=Flavobacterium sp. CFBP9031 TaxID=3096538 RepID=UPI002A6B4FAA|nr:ROK family protein [Flavobacterium sp. CFBP9031]MDY0989423.1 ROK family protein [Flavobacterium sp. CFBP9031]
MNTLNDTQISNSYAIGIDIGGTALKCGVVNELGEILFSFLVSLSEVKTEEEIINLIVSAITQCTQQLNEPIVGIGIGFPGLIENDVIVGGGVNLPGFEQLPLGKILNDITGYNIAIDNDANLMGLAEVIYGAAKDSDDAIFLTIGTGIGGAIMINKKLFGGYQNRGAELGHTIIQQNGLQCACGGIGCLESYASVTALIKYYKSQNKSAEENIDGKIIIEKYLAGEEYAVITMQHHFDYLAAGIVNYVNIFSPQKVIIGGGISEAGQFYIDELTKRVKKTAIPVSFSNTEIVAATLGNKAGLLGACANAFQKLKTLDYATK